VEGGRRKEEGGKAVGFCQFSFFPSEKSAVEVFPSDNEQQTTDVTLLNRTGYQKV